MAVATVPLSTRTFKSSFKGFVHSRRFCSVTGCSLQLQSCSGGGRV
jgi:hypothetical protein